jgi:hypothetical protein
MKMTEDKKWLREKAEQEDGCIVSVGGLITDLMHSSNCASKQGGECDCDDEAGY